MDDNLLTRDVASVIITGDLDHRASRLPDYQAENQALTALAEAMCVNPGTVLQRLVELAMELTRSDSAGISLLEPVGENGIFRWVATAGAWASYRDGTMPREASPCGEVIGRQAVLLMKNPERSFPALLQATPGIKEALLAPFHLDGVPVGTLWTIKHHPDDHFEAEDARLVKSLARFAAAAHQTVQALQVAEAAGQQAELRFQQLVKLADVSTEFFGTCDMNYMPIYGNAAAMRLVGLADLDAVKRTPLKEFFFPEDLAFITDDFLPRVLREGQAKVEIRFRHFVTGEPVWVDYSLVVLTDEMGRATGLGTVTHDLTERKRAEMALQQSDARFRSFLDTSPAFIWHNDPDGQNLFANRYFLEFVGGSEAAVGGSEWQMLVHPDQQDAYVSGYLDAVRNRRKWSDRVRARRYDGEWRWLDNTAEPLFGAAGEYLGHVGVSVDVTAEVEIEEALRESEERQAFLLNLSDALRGEPNADAKANRALRMLFEQMRLDRCYVGIYRLTEDVGGFPYQVHNDHLLPLPGQVRLSDFPNALQVASDRTLVIDDVVDIDGLSDGERASFNGLGLRAMIVATLRKGENNPLWAVVAASTCARVWTRSEVALVEEVAERTWAAVERAHAEAALRESEAKYRTLFEKMQEGFSVLERVAGEPVDYRFLAANPAYERHTGLSNPVGRTIREITPTAEDSALESYRSVEETGVSQIIVTHVPELDIWFEVEASSAEQPGQIAVLFRNITERKRAEIALRDSEERFRQFSDASTNILWIRNAATMRMEFASPAFDTIYGVPGPAKGGDDRLRSWVRLIAPEDRKRVLANFRRIRAGERVEQEFQVRRASDGALRWIQDTGFPLQNTAGKVAWVAGLGADITDAREAADRQGVLVAELQHRTRNLIAVVRSLADRTLRDAASVEDFGTRFRPRLSALSRVQGLLSHLAVGERITFKELLWSELTAHGAADDMGQKVTLDGPADVPLRSATVQTFALAIHELATNAAKYGAFDAADGHLFVSWRVELPAGSDPPWLHVEWRETGVSMPGVDAAPRGGGYGRELIERALPYQLKAQTTYEMGADGVRCTIALPIAAGGTRGGVSSRE